MRPVPSLRDCRLLLTLSASLLSLAVGCDKGKGSGSAEGAAPSASAPAATQASCDRVSSMSVCSEYAASQITASGAVLSSQCTKLGGAYVAAPCPNTALLGRCTIGTGEVRVYYASGAAAYDGARAEKDCTSSYRGKWKPFG